MKKLDLALEVNNVTSKLQSQNLSAETCDTNAEVMFTQTTVPKNDSKPQFRKNCNYCHKSNHSVSNCFRKQREGEDRRRNSYSRSKPPVESFNQYFKSYQNQIRQNELPCSYPVNYYSRNSYDSLKRSNSRNRYSPNRSSQSRSPSIRHAGPEKSPS